jgi:hypothetical protein
MHRLHSKSQIFRFRLAAFLLCLKWLMIPCVAAVLLCSILNQDHKMAVIGIGLVVFTVLVMLLQWLVSQRTNCPLCMTPVLAYKGCVKHRRASGILGSYRLRVGLAVLFRNSFCCPYCNEPTELEVRQRRRN